jgi:hypothetical protein
LLLEIDASDPPEQLLPDLKQTAQPTFVSPHQERLENSPCVSLMLVTARPKVTGVTAECGVTLGNHVRCPVRRKTLVRPDTKIQLSGFSPFDKVVDRGQTGNRVKFNRSASIKIPLADWLRCDQLGLPVVGDPIVGIKSEVIAIAIEAIRSVPAKSPVTVDGLGGFTRGSTLSVVPGDGTNQRSPARHSKDSLI